MFASQAQAEAEDEESLENPNEKTYMEIVKLLLDRGASIKGFLKLQLNQPNKISKCNSERWMECCVIITILKFTVPCLRNLK